MIKFFRVFVMSFVMSQRLCDYDVVYFVWQTPDRETSDESFIASWSQ